MLGISACAVELKHKNSIPLNPSDFLDVVRIQRY